MLGAGCLLGDSGECPPFSHIVGVGFGRETVPGADILSRTQERLRVVTGDVSTVAGPITASLTEGQELKPWKNQPDHRLVLG